ncbi:hypothetical protein [Streptomyces griseocarneus]|uniref:hypothetical protein n=1 Tax=Streptomyces griseocarneus TaxID=51201 RepID=UPI00167F0EF5|nr:hypothetical protein [Streptomyces griseocarneus]MBZ6473195.1 hypothetical protein [Streptomyces griseocarneus]GHG60354.1 hypothetical protein GCM10018779_27620 [Streptomyces griseocarneus]
MSHQHHDPGDYDQDREGTGTGTGSSSGVGSGTGSSSGVGSGSGSGMGTGPGLDEQALRRLLQGAVDDLEPSPDALEQLRRAVPLRRTRRRQAVVGAAAAVILGATALPVLIHVATTGSTADERSTNAASSRQRSHDEYAGGTRGTSDKDGDRRGSTSGPDEREDEKKGKAERGRKDGGSAGPTGSAGGTPPATAPTLAASSPTCDRDQLGKGVGTVGAADKEGRVYGAFRVVNVSGTVCAVTAAGEVAAHAQGGAESSRVSVVDHTPGDAAVGLPDPASEPSQVILQPGQAYEIQFAWIPAADGGPSGCARPSRPTPSAQPTPSTAPGTGHPAAAEASQARDDGGNAAASPAPPASVTLSHTPDAGQPKAADATIPEACAGTVYRTGPLATIPSA